jgi:hypothetical protein
MSQDISAAQQDIRELRHGLSAATEAAQHPAASSAKHAAAGSGRGKDVSAAPDAELAELAAAVETLAAAVNILATGQHAPASGELPHSSAGASTGQAGGPAAKLVHGGAGAGLGSGGGRAHAQGQGYGPAMRHLRQLLGGQQLQHKMDFFDPDILIKIVSGVMRQAPNSSDWCSHALACCHLIQNWPR